MIVGIVVYFLNFFTGKTKNQKIPNVWFNSHCTHLELQFTLVGDDGTKNIDNQEPMTKESKKISTFWCSGHICCEGMLVELKLLKRQDLVGVISNMLKPAHDQVHIRVNICPEDMDSFIFCISNKKASMRLSKNEWFKHLLPERRPSDKFAIPGNYFIIHFSGQYTRPKPTKDQQPLELPVKKQVLIFMFNILNKDKTMEEAIEDMKPLMLLVFYCLDKVKRYKLSREAKNKADKKRSNVAKNHWRSIHAVKAEKVAEERKRRKVKQGEDQGDWRPRKTEEDGGEGEQEGEEETGAKSKADEGQIDVDKIMSSYFLSDDSIYSSRDI